MRVDFIPIDDASGWAQALERFSDVPLYCDPGYVLAAALGDPAWLVVVHLAAAALALPLVVRQLPAFLGRSDLRDGESPYGYPGVLIDAAPADLPLLIQTLAGALAERGIVNVFVRLNPFRGMLLPGACRFGPPHAIALIPLKGGRELAFEGGDCAQHRAKVRKALKLGLQATWVAAPAPADLDEFQAVYEPTMDRVGASDFYYFPESYYRGLAAGLGGKLILVRVADAGDRVQAAGLFLVGSEGMYYHLGGRTGDSHYSAMHLVFEKAADLAADRGLKGIHLGGGLTDREDDTLWIFKRHVGRLTAHVQFAGIVADPGAHQGLVRRWCEAGGGEPQWFQAYRQPLAGRAGG